MSLTTKDKQDIGIIVDAAIKKGVKDGIAHLPTVEIVRDIVHEGIKPLDERVGRLEVAYKNLDFKVDTLFDGLDSKVDVIFDGLDSKIDSLDSKVDVLFEHLDAKIGTVIEIVSDNSELKKQVKDHEFRLGDVETVQPLIVKTLALHSKQLGAKL